MIRWAILMSSVALLAGCQMQDTSAGGKPAAQNIAAAGQKQKAGDIEAPEIFAQTANGLWDGRPSLGGVWVAHPDVSAPERVVIRNTATGKSVIGALFKRERALPGPEFQISSDAAETLGMLAGQPAKLSVVALKRAEKGAKAAAAAPASAEAAEDAVSTTKLPAEKAPTKAAPKAAPKTKADAALTAGLSAAIDKAEPTKASKTKPAKGAPLETSASALPAKAAQTAAPKAGFSYVQLGLFSVEANAKTAADKLAKAGLPARVVKEDVKGKMLWRVASGPFGSGDEAAANLAKVKGLGFPDAYAVAK